MQNKIKIAAYCRVSTDANDQRNSLENQKLYFENCIVHNPQWELWQIYADEGVTGTSTKKRAAFNKMIADAKKGFFELIVTKEISRFARNTLDSIYYTRQLKEYGVGVLFLQDNINTLEPDAELRLTIMASIAQEESRKTSERVKWGQRRRMEQGVVFGRELLGYKLNKGKLSIEEKEAEIVRKIFVDFVYGGKSAYAIAKELSAKKVPTSAYMKSWSTTAILRILRNEKYIGDLVQGKTITPDFLSHKKIASEPAHLVVVERNHDPIIERSVFTLAQQRLSHNKDYEKKHKARHDFSGKIVCGICGKNYVARKKTAKNGITKISWRCYEAVKHGKQQMEGTVGCNNRTVTNEQVTQMIQFLLTYLQVDIRENAKKAMPWKTKKRRAWWLDRVQNICFEKGTHIFGPIIESIVVFPDGHVGVRLMGVKENFHFYISPNPISLKEQKEKELFTV